MGLRVVWRITNPPDKTDYTFLSEPKPAFSLEKPLVVEYKQESLKTQPEICFPLEINSLHLVQALPAPRPRDATYGQSYGIYFQHL